MMTLDAHNGALSAYPRIDCERRVSSSDVRAFSDFSIHAGDVVKSENVAGHMTQVNCRQGKAASSDPGGLFAGVKKYAHKRICAGVDGMRFYEDL
jgi:hypothetical protein